MADAMLTPESPTIISRSEAGRLRAEARARGEKFFLTGMPCKNGHIAPRRVCCGNCLECSLKPPRPPAEKHCIIDGCDGERSAKKMCPRHYHMWKMHGDPLKKPKWDYGAGIRWIEDHKNYSGDECLRWPFGLSSKKTGYGQSYLDGKKIGAHVHMAIAAHGDRRSEGLIVAHTCGKGGDACCNPQHLRWSTHKENTADMFVHGTMPLGEKHHNAVLTESIVREIRSLRNVITYSAIAEKFGVARSTIKHVMSNSVWRHVE